MIGICYRFLARTHTVTIIAVAAILVIGIATVYIPTLDSNT